MDTKKLRQKVLDLAIHGKLVKQDPNDEPASVLLDRIRAEKARLVEEGKIKKSDLIEKPISEDEIPFEVPEGWEWCRIGDYNEIITGSTPSKSNPDFFGNDYPFYKPGDLIAKTITCSEDGLSTVGYNQTRKLPKNSILVCCIGSLGKSSIINKEGSCNQQINAILPSQIFDVEFLYYSVNSAHFLEEMWHKSASTTVTILNKGNFSDIVVPLPPLAEQHRIVKAVDELFEQIDIIERSEKELEEVANKTRDKLLNLAIQGHLVPQDPNEEPASVLLERIRAEKARLVKEGKLKKKDIEEKPISSDEIPFDIPEGWEWVRWGNISISIQYGYNAPAEPSGDIKMVRITDIQNNQVLWSTVPYCTIPHKEIDTYLLQPNDILFARTGGTVGKSFLVNEVPEPSIYAGYLIRTRYSKSLNPKYLKYFMESDLYWSQLREGTTSTAQPNCNGKTLSKMLIPLPPLNEQRRIVEKLEELLKEIDKLHS